MPTIETLTERVEAVTAETLGSEIFARFEREPDTLVIPVVQDHRPIGLIERNAFLLKIAGPFGHALYAHRPVAQVMDPEPAVVEAGIEIDAFSNIILKGGAGAHGAEQRGMQVAEEAFGMAVVVADVEPRRGT